jgi:hypothetical protein
VNRANAAVRVFQTCIAEVNSDALAGHADSILFLCEEIETLKLVKDISEDYGRTVLILS